MPNLKDEVINDPLGRGYSGMTAVQVVADGDIKYRTRNRTTMSRTEIINRVVKAEYNVLTDANKDLFWKVVNSEDINPFGVEADLITDIFTGGSTTITNLQTARVESISRWDDLGLGDVKVGHVERARA